MITTIIIIIALSGPSYGNNNQSVTKSSPDPFEFTDYSESDCSNHDNVSLSTASSIENESNKIQCGTVAADTRKSWFVLGGTPSLAKQWPWQVALYYLHSIDNVYICGGTLVSDRHVITAAHCVMNIEKNSLRKLNKNAFTVYLGKNNLRTSVDGVQIKFIENIIVHPEYNRSTLSHDIAILELRNPIVEFTDWVRPVCLWPENQIDLHHVVGRNGSVVGWGFDESGKLTEVLNMAEMPVVDQETCLRSHDYFFVRFTSSYTYCAGNRAGTSVCNGDSGGGMVFKNDGIWYLRGVVSLSVAKETRCDPSYYVIFTDVAKFLPWIKQNMHN